MESNLCSMNQLDSNLHLPPRKRLLAGYKKQNSISNGSYSYSSSPSPPPSSTSNGSSSASTDVHTNLDNLLASRFGNGQYQSPEELVEAARSAADLAVKAAKAARARANEKALISEKAIAAAKRALELIDSFGEEAMAVSARKIKQKKQVPLKVLYSKGLLRGEEEDLATRLQRAIDNKYPRAVSTSSVFEENGHGSKKQKTSIEGGSRSRVTSFMNGNAEVLDSDCSYEELESNRELHDEVDSEATLEKEKEEDDGSDAFGICNSKDQENGVSSQPRNDGLFPVSSWKCQELKATECVNQNKAVRSS